MGQWYSHYTKWEKDSVVIRHISGDRAIFYYFMMTKELKNSNGK